MPILREIGHFFAAFNGQWLTRMSGPLTVPFTLLALFVPSSRLKLLFSTMAIMCAVVASFGVWVVEHRARLSADENAEKNNPKIIAEFVWRDGITVYEPILLRNAGQETAANVQIKPVRFGKWVARFDLITYIEPRQHGTIKPAVEYGEFAQFPPVQGAFIMTIKGGPDDEKQSRTIPLEVTYTNLKGERLMSEHVVVWDALKRQAYISLKRCGKESSVWTRSPEE